MYSTIFHLRDDCTVLTPISYMNVNFITVTYNPKNEFENLEQDTGVSIKNLYISYSFSYITLLTPSWL